MAKFLFLSLMLSFFLTAPAQAYFANSGMLLSPTAKPGDNLVLSANMYSTENKSGVFVSIGLYKVSDQNVIDQSAPVFSKVFENQTFVAGKEMKYAPVYTVPTSVTAGRYTIITKVGPKANSSDYMIGIGLFPAWMTTISKPAVVVVVDPVISNAGMYAPTATVKAGASITLNNSLSSSLAAVLNIRYEIRSVNAVGTMDATVIASKDYLNQSFSAQKVGAFAPSFLIPDATAAGKYALAVIVTNASGRQLFNSQGVSALNSFTVTAKAVQPVVVPAISLVGTSIPNKSVNSGASILINNSIKSNVAMTGVRVINQIRAVSAAGVISSTVVATQDLTNQTLAANVNKDFALNYAIPANAASGKYMLAISVYAADGTALLIFEVAMDDINVFTVVNVAAPVATGTTEATMSLSGINIPNKTVKAGATILINSTLKSTKIATNLKIRTDLRKVLANNKVSPTPLVLIDSNAQNLEANVNKTYAQNFSIPATAEAGSYVLSVFVNSFEDKQLYGFSEVTEFNTITITNDGTVVVDNTPYVRGINIMDMGLGDETKSRYGWDYIKPTKASLQALKDRGLQTIRLPYRWERAQSTLGGPLNAEYMGLILEVLRDCKSVGLSVVLDMHNYTHYNYGGVLYAFGQAGGPTRAHYADAWSKVVKAIQADANAYASIYAYDLMNEPVNLPADTGMSEAQVWETYAQSAVEGIRATSDTKLIMVEGYSWSAPHRWVGYHPKPFITDSANNIMYQAHLYLDSDTSGLYYKSFSVEEATALGQGYASVGARAIALLRPFSDWCKQFNQKCFLGEFGWPNQYAVGETDAQKWNVAGDELMSYMDSIRMGGTMWTTGTWLDEHANELSTYLLPSATRPSIVPLSQASVLEDHILP